MPCFLPLCLSLPLSSCLQCDARLRSDEVGVCRNNITAIHGCHCECFAWDLSGYRHRSPLACQAVHLLGAGILCSFHASAESMLGIFRFCCCRDCSADVFVAWSESLGSSLHSLTVTDWVELSAEAAAVQTRGLYAPFESDLRSSSSDVYYHEMPGGQYTNLKFQVAAFPLIPTPCSRS